MKQEEIEDIKRHIAQASDTAQPNMLKKQLERLLDLQRQSDILDKRASVWR